MAGGEYTSVSAQKDSEKAALAVERQELKDNPELELRELAWFYEQKGISPELAINLAEELTAHDALKAHAEAELGIDSDQHVSPSQAAISSFVAFGLGGLLPLIAVTGPWVEYRIPATVVSVAIALVITGFVAAVWFGNQGLGLVIGLAIIVNLFAAALAGAAIPIALDKIGIDPAVSSGTFVTTVTDVVGFFAFLGIATLWFSL